MWGFPMYSCVIINGNWKKSAKTAESVYRRHYCDRFAPELQSFFPIENIDTLMANEPCDAATGRGPRRADAGAPPSFSRRHRRQKLIGTPP
jgi:hypothetical protein